MNYHPDDFLALSDEVENQGGYVQPDECTPVEFRRKWKDGGWKRDHTAGCGMPARFGITYDPSEPVHIETAAYDEQGNKLYDVVIDHPGEQIEGAAYAAVCAVDDDMGRWPRFEHVIEEGSY